MGAWADEDLHRISEAEELQIAPVRRAGELRRATPIWVVRAGDDLYVRAAYGANKGWHGVARTSRQAHIRAGGVEKDVTITDAEHRATTLRLRPLCGGGRRPSPCHLTYAYIGI
jgi:hypothetical protein